MAGHNYITFNLKRFIRSSSNIDDSKIQNKQKITDKVNFQGDEAKIAYEAIINENSESKTKKQSQHVNNKFKSEPKHSNELKNKIRNEARNQKNFTVNINSIFKSIEQGDLEFLNEHLTPENVNIVDSFGWTPLMSAAFCGNTAIIEFLLKLGANKNCREKTGLSALQLAQKNKHIAVIKILTAKTSKPSNTVEKTNDELLHDNNECLEKFYCSTCKTNFQNTTVKQHNASILHIFNLKPELPGPVYGIPKQNKGYQIMVNKGWNEKEGLGPSGSGVKFPIKTILKRDRKGLGNRLNSKPKITHFASGDLNAVKDIRRPKVVKEKSDSRKKEYEKILRKERRKEIALRQALMMKEQKRLLEYLQTVEEKAGEILTDRQEIVALDKRRNDDRVGMRALQKSSYDKCWITMGPIIMKISSKKAEELLVQDQRECDVAINNLRSDLRVKVNELRDLEHTPPVPGLMLKPLSHSEMTAINQLCGR
ncbi:G patch domain and ankyrin repeat-containing protein 1 homolog [Chelonus insularis]|uniref:G patch domain and ankyrin repeat-containing protein 1 homolog n=1 Tax=Chelonus insularis TaxID=460826 RepID=UPI00158EF7F4|nr:G patch domain and ankyrin repeat-containing protein 1 homolog [Chelonus insularis]